MKILRNSIRCKKCGEEIVSNSRHDYVECKCGACAVDGGHDYLRRCGNREDYEETSILQNETTL
nr:MAG TPA: Trm112p-like protein [Caudoviricetes sp.]